MVFNISEAKTNLSKLVDMVPHKPEGKRQLGLLRGKITVPEDFDGHAPGSSASSL